MGSPSSSVPRRKSCTYWPALNRMASGARSPRRISRRSRAASLMETTSAEYLRARRVWVGICASTSSAGRMKRRSSAVGGGAPALTRTLHCPQLAWPPHAEGIRMPARMRANRSGLPRSASITRSPELTTIHARSGAAPMLR
jgi:hypothetical protein